MATKRIGFPVFNHVVVGDLERMFEHMGRQGWHPAPFTGLSPFLMTFTGGDAADYRYICDYPAGYSEPYRQHYERYGWELVGSLGEAVIWRRPEAGDGRTPTFADRDRLELRNRKIYKKLGAGFISCTLLMGLLTFLMYSVRMVTPAFVVLLILAGDICVILLLGYLRKTLKKLDRADRDAAAPPGPYDPPR